MSHLLYMCYLTLCSVVSGIWDADFKQLNNACQTVLGIFFLQRDYAGVEFCVWAAFEATTASHSFIHSFEFVFFSFISLLIVTKQLNGIHISILRKRSSSHLESGKRIINAYSVQCGVKTHRECVGFNGCSVRADREWGSWDEQQEGFYDYSRYKLTVFICFIESHGGGRVKDLEGFIV